MNDIPPLDPTQAPNRIIPIRPAGPSLYQFALAILTLYLIMRYVPRGEYIGIFLLALVLLSTPGAVNALANLLSFIETGV